MALLGETRQERRATAANLCGAIGVVCMGVAGLGLSGQLDPGSHREAAPEIPPESETPAAAVEVAEPEPMPAVALEVPTAAAERPEPAPVPVRAAVQARPQPVYYPLEVGRYWVYDYEDPSAGGAAQIERSIVRRELRGDRELYHFSDGLIAYYEDGRVYEISADGGVNVVPMTTRAEQQPYVYQSQGMRIAKRVGSVDTVMVAAGRRYERCLEIITEFRALEGSRDRSASYSSFYARGVGLVRRQMRSRDGRHGLSVVLGEHGNKQL